MFCLTILTFLLVSATLVWVIYYLLSGHYNTKGLKRLPGPYGFPLVGYVPFFGNDRYLKLTKLSKKYGEIYQMRVGNRTVIVLNSLRLLREAHLHDSAFAGRPKIPSYDEFLRSGGGSRLFARTGKEWRFLRRSAQRALSLFSSSKNARLEAVIDVAIGRLNADIEKHGSIPFDPTKSILKTVAGVIGAICFGGYFNSDDPLLQKIYASNAETANFLQLNVITDFIPFGGAFMQRLLKRFRSGLRPVERLTENNILAHEFEGTGETVTDLADAFYVMAKETPEGVLQSLQLSRNQIRFIPRDLFGAGFPTLIDTFREVLNLIAKFDDKQRKAQVEIDGVIGKDSDVTLKDRKHLPYCEAVELEALRFHSFFPLGVPHGVMEDTELDGYFIPKNAIVLSNLYIHHMDPEIFPDPQTFFPERFLQPDGSLDGSLCQKVIAFGVGKRRCIGENLARQELFLLICRTLHRYDVRLDPNSTVDPLKYEPDFHGLVRVPPRTKIIFNER